MKELTPPNIKATPDSVREYGLLISEDVSGIRLPIPFYDHVDEGRNIPFEYNGRAVMRTARVHPTDKPVRWLERHMRMTQFFVGLGSAPFALVLCKPTQEQTMGDALPDLNTLVCFVFDPGTGFLLHKGTWHDFPLAISQPVTCLTGNSDEVINALISVKEPREMNEGDVYKVSVPDRLGFLIRVRF